VIAASRGRLLTTKSLVFMARLDMAVGLALRLARLQKP
jgi:hypothetical protein